MNNLLSLQESFDLSHDSANEKFEKYINKYLFQIFKIIGTSSIGIKGAQGVEIYLEDGSTLLDFSGGIGVVGIGHNHPRVLEAEKLCHEKLGIDSIRMMPHKLQAALAYNLAQMLPGPLDVSYFSVSGSEAVESAMKLCEKAQEGKNKTKFICIDGSFHGKTHGSLSVTNAHTFQDGFMMGVPKEHIITIPRNDIDAYKKVIQDSTKSGKNDIIALIIEPTSGESAITPTPGYLAEIIEVSKDNDILTIFDEVKVGMGRSGRFCSFQYDDVVPDVVTIAKALGGSKRAIGATISSQELFDRAYGSKKNCTLHSCSFGGLGQSCAVAIETLNILKDEKLIERAETMGNYFYEKLNALKVKHPKMIKEIRGQGLFRAVQFDFPDRLIKLVSGSDNNPIFNTYQSVLISAIVRELFDKHRVVAHFQPGAVDVMHFMPALVVTEEQIDQLTNGLDDILTQGITETTIKFVTGNIKQLFS
jgi:acetylornithine/succinyldiaminopimelate/putrescine aminotransferase